jgi:hypothetical protein
MKRDYIREFVDIDGRMIPYRIFTATVYLEEKGYLEEEIEKMFEEQYEMCQTLNQIIALKQSCYLLRHTSYSCNSLSENLFSLKLRLIKELKDKYNFEFNEDLMENDGTDYLG